VAINSKNTIDSVKFMTSFYKDTCDEGAGWDDTSNNRAFLSQTISSDANGASIYNRVAAQSDSTLPRRDTAEDRYPARASAQKTTGQFGLHTFFLAHADELLEEPAGGKGPAEVAHTPANYEKWFISQKGFATPPTAQWESHELWVAESVRTPQGRGKLGQAPLRRPRRAKKAAERADQVHHRRYDAKASRASAEDSVKWAAGELKRTTLERTRDRVHAAARWQSRVRAHRAVGRASRRRRCDRGAE